MIYNRKFNKSKMHFPFQKIFGKHYYNIHLLSIVYRQKRKNIKSIEMQFKLSSSFTYRAPSNNPIHLPI